MIRDGHSGRSRTGERLDHNLDGRTEQLRLARTWRIHHECTSGYYDDRPAIAAWVRRHDANPTTSVRSVGDHPRVDARFAAPR